LPLRKPGSLLACVTQPKSSDAPLKKATLIYLLKQWSPRSQRPCSMP
jgi:hypothetical protein